MSELVAVLGALAETEKKLVEQLYPDFFARRPDAQPLFGVHALAEREEMVRETLRSLLALADGEPWLAGNLAALGRSHFEYGVTGDMYGDFVEVFVEVAARVAGLSPSDAQTLRAGIGEIASAMRRAGDALAAPAGNS